MKVKNNFLISIFIFFTFTLMGAQQRVATRLKWVGPPGSGPGTFKEWVSSHPYSSLSVSPRMEAGKTRAEKTVAILTEQSIATSLQDEISQLSDNLISDGYSVLSYEISGGTPENLRAFLQDLYVDDSIEGALFVGDLPVAWFQYEENWEYEEWPIDLFYMDLDGEWLDTLVYFKLDYIIDTIVPGQDNIYDTHRGNITPEIYIGRLTPTGLGDDTLLLQNYFFKDNLYREGSISLPEKALVYVDDDWEYFVPIEIAPEIAIAYNDTLVISHPDSTRASDYRIKLDSLRAWVHLCAHSWPSGHGFYYDDKSRMDYYYSSEYITQDPPANFYNFYCCSFARYTEGGYGGGASIFNQTYGVGAVGSAKTGSMWHFIDFYEPLSEGKTIGEAFKDWFAAELEGGPDYYNDIDWFYGMTLLGDPFLTPLPVERNSGIREVSVNSDFNISPVISLPSRNINIECTLKTKLFTTIKLYDAAGRVKKTIFRGVMEPGCNELSLPIGKIESGVYIIRLENSEVKQSGRIIIL